MMTNEKRLLSQSSVKMKIPNAIGAAREMAVTMDSCLGLKFFAEAIEKVQGTRHKVQEGRELSWERAMGNWQWAIGKRNAKPQTSNLKHQTYTQHLLQ